MCVGIRVNNNNLRRTFVLFYRCARCGRYLLKYDPVIVPLPSIFDAPPIVYEPPELDSAYIFMN